MGHLRYGDCSDFFEDRALIHLQVVIGSKLRRDESFFLTWTTSEAGPPDARASGCIPASRSCSSFRVSSPSA